MPLSGWGGLKLLWSNRPHSEVTLYEERRLQNQSWMRLIPQFEEDVQLESAEPDNIFDLCAAFKRATDQRLKVSL